MTTDDNLEIEFKGRHDHISARMQENAAKKLARLHRYNDQVTRLEVVADNPHEHPEVELIAHMRTGAPLVAKERAESFASAVDALVDKMEKQLKREKEKRTDHKGVDKATTAGEQNRVDSEDETYEDIVRKGLRG